MVVATAEAWSQLGVVERFLTEPRYVSWDNHDSCAREMLRTLAVIEAEHLADRITVVRRDGTVLYSNELVDGVWRRQRLAADQAVTAEWSRWWSAQETAVFRRELAQTDRRLHHEVRCEDRLLAVQRDTERAAALAEPVRRIAQPSRRAPGVDYHRLSAEEHQWVFDELIAPLYLNGIIAREAPRVVYLIGQPGASKTVTAGLLRRAMMPGTIRLSSEDFKASHPDYPSLLKSDPRRAGAAIRADYRAWFTQAEQYVRDRRGDVLIEAAPGSADELLGSALPFALAAYSVEVVVLAVRAADSRLATALRYARALQAGVAGRFTTAAGHDRCYQGVADAVAACEAHPAVAAVTVMCRDGRALLRQEQPAPGGRASWALTAERLRPYTEEEAAAFLRLHQGLRRALPEHRAELDDVAALARPLLPARMQPPRIGAPRHEVRRLPLPRRGYASNSLRRAA